LRQTLPTFSFAYMSCLRPQQCRYRHHQMSLSLQFPAASGSSWDQYSRQAQCYISDILSPIIQRILCLRGISPYDSKYCIDYLWCFKISGYYLIPNSSIALKNAKYLSLENFDKLISVQLFLGILKSVVSPGFVQYTLTFFTRRKQVLGLGGGLGEASRQMRFGMYKQNDLETSNFWNVM